MPRLTYTIIVNEGPMSSDDNAIYFCAEPPKVTAEAILAPAATGEDREVTIRWIEFVPNNGRRPGAKYKVPFERVVSVTEQDR